QPVTPATDREVMEMASILTPEDVVRRIAAECTFIDERGAVGIRLRPAAAIVRQYGEQFRRPPGESKTAGQSRRRCCDQQPTGGVKKAM
ncbi:MAG TPA: hypothetical protein VHT00_12180, partial [Stellaceae bacterium]|nr:hypothetical protein [Stellaceae bacterium]